MANEFEISGLVELERQLDKLPEAFQEGVDWVIKKDIPEAWKAAAFASGAVDSHEFVNSIAGKQTSAYEFVTESDCNYSDIIESGRSDTPNYPGRHLLEEIFFQDVDEFLGERIIASIDNVLD